MRTVENVVEDLVGELDKVGKYGMLTIGMTVQDLKLLLSDWQQKSLQFSLWGKPIEYWASVKAWMDSELPISDFIVTKDVEIGNLKKQVEVFRSSYNGAAELYVKQCEKVRKLEKELEEYHNFSTAIGSVFPSEEAKWLRGELKTAKEIEAALRGIIALRESELDELKQKLLALGGCPNA